MRCWTVAASPLMLGRVEGIAMRRRKLLAALAGFILFAAGAFLLIPVPTLSRVTRENYDRIERGMTLAELEAILGPPTRWSGRSEETGFR